MTLADWDMIFSLKKNLGPHRPGKRHENSSKWKTNGKTFLSSKFRGGTSESYAIPKTFPNWVLNQEQVFAFKASRRSFSRPFCVTAVKPLHISRGHYSAPFEYFLKFNTPLKSWERGEDDYLNFVSHESNGKISIFAVAKKIVKVCGNPGNFRGSVLGSTIIFFKSENRSEKRRARSFQI